VAGKSAKEANVSYADIPLGVECAWPAAAAAPAKVSRRGTPPARQLTRLLFIAALLFGGWHLGHAAYIAGKAELAQVLIGHAWQRTLAGERAVKPWPWADTWPVAKLEAPAQGVALYVLAGANGRTIAFGPGHVFGTANPGEPGNSVIGGHRDTHLNFLKDTRVGERFLIERPDGQRVAYRVRDLRVVDKSAVEVLAQGGADQLTLVTCWPFDALRAGGPERYVVEALRVAGES
jgi:sortase A